MGGAGAGLGCQRRGSLPCLPAWAPGPPGEPGQKPGRAAPEERERRSSRKVQCWGWREKPCPGLAPLQAAPFRPATSSRLSFPRACRPKPLAGSSAPGLCSHPPALSSAAPPPSLAPGRHTGPSGHGPLGHRQGGGPGKGYLSLQGLPRTDAPSRAPTTSCDPGTHTCMHTQCPCVAQTRSAESRAGTVSVSPFSWAPLGGRELSRGGEAPDILAATYVPASPLCDPLLGTKRKPVLPEGDTASSPTQLLVTGDTLPTPHARVCSWGSQQEGLIQGQRSKVTWGRGRDGGKIRRGSQEGPLWLGR